MEPGVDILLIDGNADNEGTALYVGVLLIEDRDQIDVANLKLLSFSGEANMYYNPHRPENAYLGGLT